MDLVALLQTLGKDDIEILLTRRPEAARALARESVPTYERLAAVLASPQHVADAIKSLNVGLTRVLALVALKGGRLTRADATKEGLDAASMKAAGVELARWGLAFADKTALVAPPATLGALRVIRGVGIRLRVILEQRTSADLLAISRTLGADGDTPVTKEIMIEGIAKRLNAKGAIERLVADAPPNAQKVLAYLRANGPASRPALQQALGADIVGHGADSWFNKRREVGGLEWLTGQALAAAVVMSGYQSDLVYFVTAEVEHAMRGRLFDEYALTAPSLPSRRADPPRGPEEILSEMAALLSLWENRPPRALARGGCGVRDIKQAAKDLGLEEDLVGFLYGLAASAGLIGERTVYPRRGPGRATIKPRSHPDSPYDVITPGHRASMWAEKPDTERWLTLAHAWRDSILYCEGEDSAVAVDQLAYHGLFSPVRAEVLAIAAALPEDHGATVDEVVRAVVWALAGFEGHVVQARTIRSVARSMWWLGAGMGGELVGLSPAGRAWYRGDLAALDAVFTPGVDTFVVQADLTIMVAGRPASSLATMLRSFADATSARPAWIFTVSPASIRRALDHGATSDSILQFLAGHAVGAIPQSVTALIHDTAVAHGRIRVGRAFYYVAADEPDLVAQMVASRKLKALNLRAVSPTVAIAEGSSVEAILRTLRASGFAPVADAEAPAAQNDEDPVREYPSVPPGARPARMPAHSEILRIVADIRSQPEVTI